MSSGVRPSSTDSDAYRALALAVLLVAAAGGVPGLGTATAATTATTTSDPAAVYADANDVLHVLYSNGTTDSLGVTAAIAGRAADFDDDGALEAPYVNGSGYLNLVGMDGATVTLASGVQSAPIGVGDLDGDDVPSVFYESSGGTLYRVEAGEAPTKVGSGLAANGALGVADYDGDGSPGIVFLGSSSTVKWYDGSVGSTQFSSFGTNNGYGIGAPTHLSSAGTVVVPIVKSNNVKILYANGTYEAVTSNYGKAAKSQLAGVDWTGDGTKEILHVNTDNNEIYLAYQNGSVDPLTADGSTVVASAYVGVAGAAPPPAPEITDFDATNPGGRDVVVSFNSSDELANISVDVDGPDPATLTEGDFNESGSGPYHYEATYTPDADGTYDATLTLAENRDGYDGAANQTASVTVDTPAPTVTNVTLTERDGGDGLVADGDTLRVTATVNNSSTLTAVSVDASAFGAGTVSLDRVSGGYAANVTVDAADAAADGAHDVSVTAVNEYGHGDANTSGTVVLDTTPPAVDPGPDRSVLEDTRVYFDASGTTDATHVAAYTWRFPDGTSVENVTAIHTFAEPGTYEVTLTATDALGHTASANVTVSVEREGDGGVRVVTRTVESTGDSTTATGDGGSTGTGNASAPPTTVALNVTRRGTTARVTNLRVNETVTVPVRNVSANGTTLRRLGFVSTRRGGTRVRAVALGSAPPGVPALASRVPVASKGYFRISHGIADENVSGATFRFTVPRARLDGAAPEDVSLYRYDDGSWTALGAQFVTATSAGYRFRAHSPGLSTFAVGVRRGDPAVTAVRASNRTVNAGATVVVSAVVANHGSDEATLAATLAVNDSARATRAVTVPAGENRTVTFAVTLSDPGRYTLAVENESTSVRVTDAASADAGTQPADGTRFDWLPGDNVPLVGVAVALLLASLGALKTRRGGK